MMRLQGPKTLNFFCFLLPINAALLSYVLEQLYSHSYFNATNI